MIKFEKAHALAKGFWPEVDYVTEYESAYVFSKFGDMSIGGMGPIVVMKETGECMNYTWFIHEYASEDELSEGYVSER